EGGRLAPSAELVMARKLQLAGHLTQDVIGRDHLDLAGDGLAVEQRAAGFAGGTRRPRVDGLAVLDEDARLCAVMWSRHRGEDEGNCGHAKRNGYDPLPVAGEASEKPAQIDIDVRRTCPSHVNTPIHVVG